jgi:saccharopine dehydrogenase (NADP+, L-glutamate forming)
VQLNDIAMQPQILIIGAGKSATVLIQYLQKKAVENNWYIILADHNLQVAEQKWNQANNGHAVGFDIEDASTRAMYIANANIVVSMLPAFLHYKVAIDCLRHSKPLFTASYLDENMKSMAKELEAKKILFLCEMGLDPGIDHMSAMELIHRIQKKGGIITSFKSHCGGLIAPESDDNPWHYKISWNPRNIILAGKAGAVYLEQGMVTEKQYAQLFSNTPILSIPQIGDLTFYPNRDSLSYIDTYSLKGVSNFVRTTLRHPDFCKGWNVIVQLGLTSEAVFESNGPTSVKTWFQNHINTNHLELLYDQYMQDDMIRTQFNYLGLNDEIDIPLSVNTCNASILQWILEQKWQLAAMDKDMVVMVHEITYTLHQQEHHIESSLVLKGEDHIHTAMAKTVGMPLALGVCAYLKGEITISGLHIPTHPEIYTPILQALAKEGIQFKEKEY